MIQKVDSPSTHPIPSGEGAYGKATQEEIHATLLTLQHFKAFLASDCTAMHDPYTMDDFPRELTREEAKKKLHWLVQNAINRKAGIPDFHYDDPVPGLAKYWRWSDIVRLARNLNTPRLVVWERECPEEYRNKITPGRLMTPERWEA